MLPSNNKQMSKRQFGHGMWDWFILQSAKSINQITLRKVSITSIKRRTLTDETKRLNKSLHNK
jgi:hypothetical protein